MFISPDRNIIYDNKSNIRNVNEINHLKKTKSEIWKVISTSIEVIYKIV